MSNKIKAEVLKYRIFFHGIFCGEAELKLLDGKNEGKIITIKTTEHYENGDVIEIYECEK